MSRKFSIIVCTYNRLQILEKTLSTITNINYPKDCFEVIVVDDYGIESSKSIAAQFESIIDIKYIRNNKNLQLAASRNIGACNARYEFLIFLDNDIRVDCYILREINLVFDDIGDDCCQVFNIAYSDDSLIQSQFTRYVNSRHPGFRYKHKESMNWNLFGATGCCMSLYTYKKCGKFDETFKRYGGEDEDYGIRLEQMGVIIILNILAVCLHDDPCDIVRWKNKYLNSFRFGYKKLNLKHAKFMSSSYKVGYSFIKYSILNRLVFHSFKPVFILLEKFLIMKENKADNNFGFLNRLVIYYWFLKANYEHIEINRVSY
jgi:glycosyltransferase involved in cell wall biosynthesis